MILFALTIFLPVSFLFADAPGTPLSSRGEGLTRREYIIPDGFFYLPIERNGDVKKQLSGRGAHFAPDTIAIYQAGAHKLIVVGSNEETTLIEKLLVDWKAARASGARAN